MRYAFPSKRVNRDVDFAVNGEDCLIRATPG